jgi:hypothetical protein
MCDTKSLQALIDNQLFMLDLSGSNRFDSLFSFSLNKENDIGNELEKICIPFLQKM